MILEIDPTKLWSDLKTLCSFGGRFAGSESELRARQYLKEKLAAMTGEPATIHEVPYNGWCRESWDLKLLTPNSLTLPRSSSRTLPIHAARRHRG